MLFNNVNIVNDYPLQINNNNENKDYKDYISHLNYYDHDFNFQNENETNFRKHWNYIIILINYF